MDALGMDNDRKIKRLSRFLYAAGSVIVAMLFLLSYAHFNDGQPSEPLFDPLGDYPVQIVTAEEILDDGTKAAFLEGDVEVEGTKCNDTNEVVEVTGFITWQAIDPPGVIIETGEGRSEYAPGCTTTVFQNQIPIEVAIAIQSQHDNGIDQPIWHIEGIEWPIDAAGDRGKPARFETENFAVLAGSP